MEKRNGADIGADRPFTRLLPREITSQFRMREIEGILEHTPVDGNTVNQYSKTIPAEYKKLKSFALDVVTFLNATYCPISIKPKIVSGRAGSYSFDIPVRDHPVVKSIRGRIKSEDRFLDKYHTKLEVYDTSSIKDCAGLEIIVNDEIDTSKNFINKDRAAWEQCYYIADQLENYFNPLTENGSSIRKDFLANPELREYKGKIGSYEALHLYLFDARNTLHEVQIKLASMDKRAKTPGRPEYHGICKTSSKYMVND